MHVKGQRLPLLPLHQRNKSEIKTHTRDLLDAVIYTTQPYATPHPTDHVVAHIKKLCINSFAVFFSTHLLELLSIIPEVSTPEYINYVVGHGTCISVALACTYAIIILLSVRLTSAPTLASLAP